MYIIKVSVFAMLRLARNCAKYFKQLELCQMRTLLKRTKKTCLENIALLSHNLNLNTIFFLIILKKPIAKPVAVAISCIFIIVKYLCNCFFLSFLLLIYFYKRISERARENIHWVFSGNLALQQNPAWLNLTFSCYFLLTYFI